MFNPYERKPSQDEIDMREFIKTEHYINKVAPILQQELRDYQAWKRGGSPAQTQIPQPPKDYKK